MYCTLHYYVSATLWGRPIDGDMLGQMRFEARHAGKTYEGQASLPL